MIFFVANIKHFWIKSTPFLGCINKKVNLPKYLSGKNGCAHQIQHSRFTQKQPSDVCFWSFLVVFFQFENSKVGLNEETVQQNWMHEFKKFWFYSKVQPKISSQVKNRTAMTSSWPEMTSSKIFRISINLGNSEDYDPSVNNENNKINFFFWLLNWLKS